MKSRLLFPALVLATIALAAQTTSDVEITAEHVLASACMPFTMRAPVIDGEAYWDGGYMGNPAIFPVIYGCESHDIILIQLTPTERAELPTNSRAIINRM